MTLASQLEAVEEMEVVEMKVEEVMMKEMKVEEMMMVEMKVECLKKQTKHSRCLLNRAVRLLELFLLVNTDITTPVRQDH